MGIGEAIKLLAAGEMMAREGWNGRGIFLEMQVPDSNSKMTQPYIYINTRGLISDCLSATKGLVPWVASQSDLLANDWVKVV